LFDLAGRSEVDVDVPARRRWGLVAAAAPVGEATRSLGGYLTTPQPESARMVAGEREVNQKSLICPHSAASSCP